MLLGQLDRLAGACERSFDAQRQLGRGSQTVDEKLLHAKYCIDATEKTLAQLFALSQSFTATALDSAGSGMFVLVCMCCLFACLPSFLPVGFGLLGSSTSHLCASCCPDEDNWRRRYIAIAFLRLLRANFGRLLLSNVNLSAFGVGGVGGAGKKSDMEAEKEKDKEKEKKEDKEKQKESKEKPKPGIFILPFVIASSKH